MYQPETSGTTIRNPRVMTCLKYNRYISDLSIKLARAFMHQGYDHVTRIGEDVYVFNATKIHKLSGNIFPELGRDEQFILRDIACDPTYYYPKISN